jgi:hypothetical protein
MWELKPLSHAGIPRALGRAERYRLLNEPWQAESICRDILAIDPEDQSARIMLVLSLTDQFDQGVNAQDALSVIAHLRDEYERRYYTGIVHERRAVALLRHGDFRSGAAVYALFCQAMEWYEKAQTIRPEANDDALLRWNTCVRFLRRNPQLSPPEQIEQPVMSE